jgi:predicted Zn-dependent peptidase
VIGLRFGALFLLGALFLPAQELRDYERKVSEFTLSNGLHFIILERHQAPIVSFHTYLNAGSTEDPARKTGLASLIARLAFNGTETIGTKNWPLEKKALEAVEAAFDRMDDERGKGFGAKAGAFAILQAGESTAMGDAFQQQNPDEYLRAIQENGGVALDSHATQDSIETSYSLPSNRVELWFVLESQRLAHPVFRDFYRERSKQAEDMAYLGESKSPARVRQSLLSAAFENLPYRNPVLGWPGDVVALRAGDAKDYLDTYGGPGNIVIAIVGDVDPAAAQRLAERYFGPIPARPHPPLVRSQESAQSGPKTVALWGDSPPYLIIGYKRPPEIHRDDPAFDILATILGDPQTGWLHQELVEQKEIAQSAEALSDFPAARYVNLFVVSATPAKDHTVEENQKAIDEIVARLQSRPIDAATLARVKNVLRGRFVRLLGGNQELAALLPDFYVTYGDWRKLFSVGENYDRVTAEEMQRVALEYLIPAHRTVAYLTSAPPPGGAASSHGGLQ